MLRCIEFSKELAVKIGELQEAKKELANAKVVSPTAD
jgi:hypothetical protein